MIYQLEFCRVYKIANSQSGIGKRETDNCNGGILRTALKNLVKVALLRSACCVMKRDSSRGESLFIHLSISLNI